MGKKKVRKNKIKDDLRPEYDFDYSKARPNPYAAELRSGYTINSKKQTKPGLSVAVFPGMFDPVTHGHLDIIERAARLYDRLVVAVGDNPLKKEVFTPDERREMLAAHTAHIPNVEVVIYSGLTVEFAKSLGARVILRGIRDNVDLHAELEIATTNLIMGGIETVFLMTEGRHILTSSALIKQIVQFGKYDPDHLARLVPLDVAHRLEAKLRAGKNP